MMTKLSRLLSLCLLLPIVPAACSSEESAWTDEARREPARGEQTSQPRLVTGERALELLDGERRDVLAKLVDANGPIDIVVEEQSRSIVSIAGTIRTAGDRVSDRAIKFLDIYQILIDPLVPSKEYQLAPQDPSCYESAVVFDRIVDGIPVLGSRVTIHFNAAHEIESVTNGVAPVPSTNVEVDPWSIPNAKPLEALLPEGYEGELSHSKVLVPAPDRSGLVTADLVGWHERGQREKDPSISRAAVVINGVAITDKLHVVTDTSQLPTFSVYEPQYLDKDGLPLPEYITYRNVGGVGVNSFPWEHNPIEMTYRFLEEHPSLMRSFASRCQFAPKGVTEDPAIPGVYFVRLQQKYGPLPVFASELVVMQEGFGKVMSVSGRTLSKIEAAQTPSLAVPDALDIVANTLLDGVAHDPEQKTAVYEALQQPSKVTLGVLPAHKQDPAFGQSERLVYEVQRGPYVFYVDTETGEPIGSRSLIASANIVTDAMGRNELSWPFIIDDRDGTPTGAISPRNLDNVSTRPGGNTAASLSAVTAFYGGFGWMGSNGRGADWVANTNVNSMFVPCQNAFFDGVLTGQTFFCLGMAADDVVGHEFTHGVVHASSGLWFSDQSGALNEAYGDIMGNLITPDATPGSWLHGELTTTGPSRDMKFPGVAHISQFMPRDSTCTIWPWSCDSGNVHSNAGIINRAHVLLTDGIPNPAGGPNLTPGIGRLKMARLMFDTMTKRLWSDARLHDAAVATRDVCDMFVARGVTVGMGIPFTISDCDQVTASFNQVGLSGGLDTGWQEPTLGFRGSRVFFGSGEPTDNGCPVTNVVADLRTISGDMSADLSPSTALPPMTSYYFGAQSIALRLSATPIPFPIGTTSKFHIVDWTNVFGVEPRYGTRVDTVASCAPPPTQVTRTSPMVFSDNMLFGNRGTSFIGGIASRWDAGCTLTDTNVELIDAAGNVMPGSGTAHSVIHTVTHWFFNLPINYNQTASIAAFPPGGTSSNLVAGVNWAYDIGRGPIRVRLRYTITQPAGGLCLP